MDALLNASNGGPGFTWEVSAYGRGCGVGRGRVVGEGLGAGVGVGIGVRSRTTLYISTQVVRVKTPAVDYFAIGRDEIRRDQTPAIRHDHAARFQKREEIEGFFCLESEANKSALTTGRVLKPTTTLPSSLTSRAVRVPFTEDRAHALNLRLPDPSVIAKGVTSADNRVAVRADGVRLAIETAVASE